MNRCTITERVNVRRADHSQMVVHEKVIAARVLGQRRVPRELAWSDARAPDQQAIRNALAALENDCLARDLLHHRVGAKLDSLFDDSLHGRIDEAPIECAKNTMSCFDESDSYIIDGYIWEALLKILPTATQEHAHTHARMSWSLEL